MAAEWVLLSEPVAQGYGKSQQVTCRKLIKEKRRKRK